MELARLDFVRRKEDFVITGKPGTGKSHILKAFGLRACEQGVSIRYGVLRPWGHHVGVSLFIEVDLGPAVLVHDERPEHG